MQHPMSHALRPRQAKMLHDPCQHVVHSKAVAEAWVQNQPRHDSTPNLASVTYGIMTTPWLMVNKQGIPTPTCRQR